MSEEQEKIRNLLILELKILDELENDIRNIITRLQLHRHFVKSALDLRKIIKTEGGLYLFEEEEEDKRVLTFPSREENYPPTTLLPPWGALVCAYLTHT